ncbi:hypothetical protein F4678DRAFT_167147 [Xylaria arbuscula]|nr:hypothetical protein F4678DRAFT_167147 [Xylaria arbuscula]
MFSVPPLWQRAINAGVFADEQTTSFGCPAGNCMVTEPFSTVAFCSSRGTFQTSLQYKSEPRARGRNVVRYRYHSCYQELREPPLSDPCPPSYLNQQVIYRRREYRLSRDSRIYRSRDLISKPPYF